MSAIMGTGLDSLDALKAFSRAAQLRSFFSDAGQQLGLSSAAVGKAAARLEKISELTLGVAGPNCYLE